jgi:hypothetical protein
MTYRVADVGRVDLGPSNSGSLGYLTFDAVQERLIEAVHLWRRSPGGGSWPFAGDAPWHLMTRRTRVAIAEEVGIRGRDLQLHMQAEDAEETKRWEGRDHRGPLSRDEVALCDETTEWLGLVPDRDRKLVILALTQLSSGRATIDWRRVKAQLGAEIGSKGLYRRYSRAISGIAKTLNGSSAL